MSPEELANIPRTTRLVVCAGASRSGSTLLYNMTRILLERSGAAPSAGWIKDLQEPLRDVAVVKLHAWHPEVAERADAVFASYRDLRQVARSRHRMGWLREGEAMYDQIAAIVSHHEKWERRADATFSFERLLADSTDCVRQIANVLDIEASLPLLEQVPQEAQGIAAPESLPDGAVHDSTTLLHINHRGGGRSDPFEFENEVHERFLGWQNARGYFYSKCCGLHENQRPAPRHGAMD